MPPTRHRRQSDPARRVFHWADPEDTRPDRALSDAFEMTRPGEADEEDAPTLVRWALPAIGLLAAGVFFGRMWARRAAERTLVAGEELASGLDLLGAAE